MMRADVFERNLGHDSFFGFHETFERLLQFPLSDSSLDCRLPNVTAGVGFTATRRFLPEKREFHEFDLSRQQLF